MEHSGADTVRNVGELRFDQINIVVADLRAATDFLRALGAPVPAAMPGWEEWGAHHVAFPTADGFGADLDSSAFASNWGGLARSFDGVVVNLRTRDRDEVDSVHDQALALGAQSLRAPYDAFWGARYAVVQGPGPIAVGLMSPIDSRTTKPPPSLSDFA